MQDKSLILHFYYLSEKYKIGQFFKKNYGLI
jgi:hypothetical protein